MDKNKSALERLDDLGYQIFEDPADPIRSYGKLTQKSDNAKGLKWIDQKNYDLVGDSLI
jgi:hypothetical protein